MWFSLLDQLVEMETAQRAVAHKTFPPGDKLLEDHFPGFQVVPGALLTEAMVQTGGWLIVSTRDFSILPFLSLIDKAKFRRFVAPGEHLRIEANARSFRESNFEIQASAEVGRQCVAEARIFYSAVPVASKFAAGDFDFETWSRGMFRRLGGESALAAGRDRKQGDGAIL